MKLEDKLNASYNNRWTDFNDLVREAKVADNRHGQIMQLASQGAEVAALRIAELLKAGEEGRSLKDFQDDPEVKRTLADTRKQVDDLEKLKEALQTRIIDCRDAFLDLKNAAAKLADGKFKGKVDTDKVGRKKTDDMAELSAAAEAMAKNCNSEFAWLLRWEKGKDHRLSDDGFHDAVAKLKSVVADASVQTIQSRLDPRVGNKKINAAKLIMNKLREVLSDGKSSGGPASKSPVGQASQRADRTKAVQPLIKQLAELRNELAEAVASVTPQRLAQMKASGIDKDRQNFNTHAAAKASLAQLDDYVEESQRLLDKP